MRFVVVYSLCCIGFSAPVRASDPGIDHFESKIRPILVNSCYACHSHQSKKTKAGLALDSAGGWRTGGDSGPAIAPGKPAESLLIKAIRYGDDNLKMPPTGKLPDAAIAEIEKWIAMGAPDPRTTVVGAAMTAEQAKSWWAFQPIGSLSKGNRIDELVKARLSDKKLSLGPPSDPRTLVRRIYLDLWGLPPTLEQVNDFKQPAIQELIDRLMLSPHFGERWARHWLDVARFGESSGYEHDNDRPHAWQYRDFVIEAIRSDLPFDKFVQWQIAGDELDPEVPMALKATGFLAAGIKNGQVTEREVLKERYEDFDDWIGTIGTGFLGLTIGCARCHDHKFDAIAAKDYYRLAANFTKTVRVNSNIPRDPASFRQACDQHHRRVARLESERQQYEEHSASKLADLWLKQSPEPPAPPWLILAADEYRQGKTKRGLTTNHDLTRQPDGSYLFTRLNGDVGPIEFTVTTNLEQLGYLRLEALTDDTLPNFGPGFGDWGNFSVSVAMSMAHRDQKPKSIKLEKVKSTTGEKPAGASWSVGKTLAGRDHAAVFKLVEPIGSVDGIELKITLTCPGDSPSARQTIGRFRIAVTGTKSNWSFEAPEMAHDDYLAGVRDLSEKQLTPNVVRLYCLTDAEWNRNDASIRAAKRNWRRPDYDVSFGVTESPTPYRMMIQGPDIFEKTHILKRGDPNKQDAVAEPGILPFLANDDWRRWYHPPPPGAPTSHHRAAVARWLTDVEQGAGALTARVIVNRIWQHHFGKRLVATPSDFGAQGDRPSHPELLDYLASELVRSRWSLKHIHRLIMTSATYQQNSELNREAAKIDPDATLLWRYPPHRLEAEAIRDSLLRVSGRLDPKPFGPGTLDEKMTRRSIYFTVKRSKLIPSLVQLDWPESLIGVGRRTATTVPTQALWMMNNPQARECAKALAARLDGLNDSEAIARVYEICLSRPPSQKESNAALSFLQNDHAEVRTDFVHTVLMLSEFATIK